MAAKSNTTTIVIIVIIVIAIAVLAWLFMSGNASAQTVADLASLGKVRGADGTITVAPQPGAAGAAADDGGPTGPAHTAEGAASPS